MVIYMYVYGVTAGRTCAEFSNHGLFTLVHYNRHTTFAHLHNKAEGATNI